MAHAAPAHATLESKLNPQAKTFKSQWVKVASSKPAAVVDHAPKIPDWDEKPAENLYAQMAAKGQAKENSNSPRHEDLRAETTKDKEAKSTKYANAAAKPRPQQSPKPASSSNKTRQKVYVKAAAKGDSVAKAREAAPQVEPHSLKPESTRYAEAAAKSPAAVAIEVKPSKAEVGDEKLKNQYSKAAAKGESRQVKKEEDLKLISKTGKGWEAGNEYAKAASKPKPSDDDVSPRQGPNKPKSDQYARAASKQHIKSPKDFGPTPGEIRDVEQKIDSTVETPDTSSSVKTSEKHVSGSRYSRSKPKTTRYVKKEPASQAPAGQVEFQSGFDWANEIVE